MVDDIIKACRNPKIQVVTPIVVFGAVLLLMLTAFEYSIAPYFAYPEEEYSLLEEEAEKILAQGNFESQYVDTIEYEVKSDVLRVSLNTTKATLRMNFSEYGEENQSVRTYRMMNKGIFWFLGALIVLVHYFLNSLILLLFTMLGFNLLECVCVKIKRMRETQTKTKNRKGKTNMLKKIKNFCFDEYTFKLVVIGCLILVTVALFTVGFNDFVKPIFVYPEEEYQLLEAEAQRIIDEKTLNTEFRHDVNYSNTLENKSVEVKVYGDGASVVIDVDNYGEEAESVNVYRSQTKGVMYYIQYVATLILSILLFTAYLFVLVMVLLFILGTVCKFLDWMIRALKY